jgi:hypothetical protein
MLFTKSTSLPFISRRNGDGQRHEKVTRLGINSPLRPKV